MSKKTRRPPNHPTRKEIESFFGHYADLLAHGDDVGRNYRNQHDHSLNALPRDRVSISIELSELDYEFARFFGNGWISHGIRRALAEARGRCCTCDCCTKVRIENERPDRQAIMARERLKRLIESGYFS